MFWLTVASATRVHLAPVRAFVPLRLGLGQPFKWLFHTWSVLLYLFLYFFFCFLFFFFSFSFSLSQYFVVRQQKHEGNGIGIYMFKISSETWWQREDLRDCCEEMYVCFLFRYIVSFGRVFGMCAHFLFSHLRLIHEVIFAQWECLFKTESLTDETYSLCATRLFSLSLSAKLLLFYSLSVTRLSGQTIASALNAYNWSSEENEENLF